MSDDSKKSKKRLLPSLLLATTLAAPAVAAPPDLNDLVLNAENTTRHVLVDAQANYDQVESITAPQWAEVVWGKVTWVRGGLDDF